MRREAPLGRDAQVGGEAVGESFLEAKGEREGLGGWSRAVHGGGSTTEEFTVYQITVYHMPNNGIP